MELYEEMQLVRGFYGSEFSKNRVCAFCKKHHLYMTPQQMSQRKCLRRQCGAFEKCESHPIWHQREVMKQKKKAKKQVNH